MTNFEGDFYKSLTKTQQFLVRHRKLGRFVGNSVIRWTGFYNKYFATEAELKQFLLIVEASKKKRRKLDYEN